MEKNRNLSLVESMFLCIGNGQIIDTQKIVIILDIRKAEREQFSSSKQKARAAILLKDGSLHLSKISPRALGRRIERWGGR